MFRFAAFSVPVTLRRLGLLALACSAVALSGCGGGSRAEAYKPSKIISFGDENSYLGSYTGNLLNASSASTTLNGLTYSVNYVVTGTTYTCAYTASSTITSCGSTDSSTFSSGTTNYYILSSTYPNTVTSITVDSTNNSQQAVDTTYYCNSPTLWIQTLAHSFSLGFNTKCPLESYANAETYATVGAKVADVVSQINTNIGQLNSNVLVTVMVGQNDILELFNDVVNNGVSQSTAESTLRARADTMAASIQAVMNTGAKVVLALTPSLGQSPLGVNNTTYTNLLTALTTAFNDELYITKLGSTSGRKMAGVNTDLITNTSTRSSSYVHSAALCSASTTVAGAAYVTKPDGAILDADGGTSTTAVPSASNNWARNLLQFCSTNTFVSSGSSSTYIWADLTHFAVLGHSLVGSTAYSRAYNQF